MTDESPEPQNRIENALALANGEDLRRWHNLDTQIRNEGEIANEKGGVLNPAIMSIG